MEMLKKMLKNREENQASISAKRLDRLWVKKQKEKDSKIKKLRSENIKCNFEKNNNIKTLLLAHIKNSFFLKLFAN